MIKSYKSLAVVIFLYTSQSVAADLDVKKLRAKAASLEYTQLVSAHGAARERVERGDTADFDVKISRAAGLSSVSPQSLSAPTAAIPRMDEDDAALYRNRGPFPFPLKVIAFSRDHSGSMVGADYNNDLVVCLSGGSEDSEEYRPYRWLPKWLHEQNIRSATFSRCGGFLATTSDDGFGSISVWGYLAQRLSLFTTFKTQQLKINAVAFRNAFMLVSASQDGMVKLWNLKNLESIVCDAMFKGHNGKGVNSIGFIQDGDTLITAGEDGMIRAWSADALTPSDALTTPDFSPLWEVQVAEDPQSSSPVKIAINSNESDLASIHNSTLKLWRIDFEPIDDRGELDHSKYGSPRLVEFGSTKFGSTNRSLLASATDASVVLWDFWAKVPLQVIEMSASTIQFSRDSMRLAVADRTGTCSIFEKNPTQSVEQRREGVFHTLVDEYQAVAFDLRTETQRFALKKLENKLRSMISFLLRSSGYPFDAPLVALLRHNATHALYKDELARLASSR